MPTRLEDLQQINRLINNWMLRDLGQWEALRALFHQDGTIEVTWFEGLFNDFVDASIRMGTSDLRTKHLIGSPVVTLNGNKAIIQTNAVIIGENIKMNLGFNVHNRFYDFAEKRGDHWKLYKRQSIYDMSAFTFPIGFVEIDQQGLAKYPREYAPLAYVLERSGFPVKRVFATRGSALEQKMKADGQTWLIG